MIATESAYQNYDIRQDRSVARLHLLEGLGLDEHMRCSCGLAVIKNGELFILDGVRGP
jgi:hypothetical protein